MFTIKNQKTAEAIGKPMGTILTGVEAEEAAAKMRAIREAEDEARYVEAVKATAGMGKHVRIVTKTWNCGSASLRRGDVVEVERVTESLNNYIVKRGSRQRTVTTTGIEVIEEYTEPALDETFSVDVDVTRRDSRGFAVSTTNFEVGRYMEGDLFLCSPNSGSAEDFEAGELADVAEEVEYLVRTEIAGWANPEELSTSICFTAWDECGEESAIMVRTF